VKQSFPGIFILLNLILLYLYREHSWSNSTNNFLNNILGIPVKVRKLFGLSDCVRGDLGFNLIFQKMRTQKNQIALAELEFSYQALKRPVNVNEAKNSIQFLK